MPVPMVIVQDDHEKFFPEIWNDQKWQDFYLPWGDEEREFASMCS